MRYCRTGFPHSDISGSKLICSSPKLFAAYHVLHRLLMPRHSPCALLCLTFVEAYFVSFAAEQAHRLIHFVASPLKFRPAALGSEFVHSVPASCADLSGSNLLRVVQSLGSLSIRIMQTHLFYQQNCNYPFVCQQFPANVKCFLTVAFS